MNEKEMIQYRIKELEETIEFLENKKNIETWVVEEFLMNLNIRFNRNEVKKSDEEPPDIIFRDFNFEVKAIYDEDRRMLKEYKDILEKAKKASTYAETLDFEEYTPKNISIQEIANLINRQLESYILSPEQYQKIDMLFYFNRFHHGITDNPQYTFPNEKLWKKWRSISMVKNGGVNFIFWTQNSAPSFIKQNVGRIVFKNKLLQE